MVLAKMIEKPRFWRYEEWKNIIFSIEDSLKRCIELCDTQDKGEINRIVKNIIELLGYVDKRDMRFINSVVEQGIIKIGSTLYAQGISLGNAAFLSGARKEDISQYAGGTLISDRFGKTLSISERIKNVRPVFRD
jgi:hypothetical protein